MHEIKVFAELHWAISRPQMRFRLNEKIIHATIEIHSRDECQEKVIYIIAADTLQVDNILEIELFGKEDRLTTNNCDHWSDIKNIVIDGVSADTMIYSSVFQHKMSQEWVDQMSRQGVEIQSSYTPGTSLRLNGIMRWNFAKSFSSDKLLHLWNA